jgi:exonuclease III
LAGKAPSGATKSACQSLSPAADNRKRAADPLVGAAKLRTLALTPPSQHISDSSSLLSILSFNSFHMSDFAGIAGLLRDHRPHLAFIQEVSHFSSLPVLAAAFGYTASLSTSLEPPKRTIAILARCPAQVRALIPGYVQHAVLGDLSFIHLHLPSGGWSGAAVENRAAMLRDLHQHLQGPVAPVLVGDFNCVISQADTEDQAFVANCKFSQELFDIVSDFQYVDAFCVLFPVKVQLSWHCRSKSSSRLDRVYLPPLLESRPRVVLYVPTVSDHHALVVRLETAGIAALPPAPPPGGSFYRKFNSAVLRTRAFCLPSAPSGSPSPSPFRLSPPSSLIGGRLPPSPPLLPSAASFLPCLPPRDAR